MKSIRKADLKMTNTRKRTTIYDLDLRCINCDKSIEFWVDDYCKSCKKEIFIRKVSVNPFDKLESEDEDEKEYKKTFFGCFPFLHR